MNGTLTGTASDPEEVPFSRGGHLMADTDRTAIGAFGARITSALHRVAGTVERMSDTRHYRERLADEATSRVRRQLTHALPNVLTEAQMRVTLGLIHRAVVNAVDELDQRELWRTD